MSARPRPGRRQTPPAASGFLGSCPRRASKPPAPAPAPASPRKVKGALTRRRSSWRGRTRRRPPARTRACRAARGSRGCCCPATSWCARGASGAPRGLAGRAGGVGAVNQEAGGCGVAAARRAASRCAHTRARWGRAPRRRRWRWRRRRALPDCPRAARRRAAARTVADAVVEAAHGVTAGGRDGAARGAAREQRQQQRGGACAALHRGGGAGERVGGAGVGVGRRLRGFESQCDPRERGAGPVLEAGVTRRGRGDPRKTSYSPVSRDWGSGRRASLHIPARARARAVGFGAMGAVRRRAVRRSPSAKRRGA
jgi:hypothetical protein